MVVGHGAGEGAVGHRVQIEGGAQLPQGLVRVAALHQHVAAARARHVAREALAFEQAAQRQAGGVEQQADQVEQQADRDEDEDGGEECVQHAAISTLQPALQLAQRRDSRSA